MGFGSVNESIVFFACYCFVYGVALALVTDCARYPRRYCVYRARALLLFVIVDICSSRSSTSDLEKGTAADVKRVVA